MCGISGFYQYSNRSNSPFTEEAANRIQSHRGPDCQSGKLLNHGKVALFHQRLSIIDLSEYANQPMTVKCDCCGQGLWVAYNGEIYNYRELKEDLIKRGHIFTSHSDTEVIIHLYAEYGVKALQRLNGIFSLALFDGRENITDAGMQKNDLLIARDPLGVKPLYYNENQHYFSFASELKTLLLDKTISREIDYSAVNDYLTFLWAPHPKTMLKHVSKLEPGHYMVIRNGKIRQKVQYYHIPIVAEKNKPCFSEQEWIEQAQLHLEQAITRQMIADVPIGAFLSGGLDSSAIVAMMKKHHPQREIDCYTIGFKDVANQEGFAEDLPYAQKVAKHLDVRLHTVTVGSDIYKKIPEMIYYLDEPQADPAPINAMLIAKEARNQGYKVLMSGAGGDDIFSGYRRHYALNIDKNINRLPSFLRKMVAYYFRSVALGKGIKLSNAIIRRLTKLLSYCDLSGDDKLASYFCWSHQDLRAKLLSNEALSALPSLNNLSAINYHLQDLTPAYSELDKILLLDCKHFLSDHNLNYTDKMTMVHSIETRVPLLDLDLVNFCYQLPATLKQNGRTGKYLFKKAMENYLPYDVIYRPKTGFGAPLRQWIHQDMSSIIHSVLSYDNVLKRGLFNYAAIQRLIAMDKKGKIDASYIIFSMFCIELWCQTFIDNETPQIVNIW